MARLSFLLFLICGFAQSVTAQNCTSSISGIILDIDGTPLPHAALNLQRTEHNTISDLHGAFQFTGLCAGNYVLSVSFIGYETRSISVIVPTSTALTIRLQPSTTILEDVVIEGEQGQAGSTQTISMLEQEDLAALHGKPLGESLKEIPGVNALQTGPSIFKPVIDGLHSQRVLILNNGIRQEGQQWGVEHAPEVDPFIASQIQVVKGAETVRYGSAAMGGVIIINPPPLHQTEKVGGEINVGLMSNNRMGVFSGLVEGTMAERSRWAWRLQSSVKKRWRLSRSQIQSVEHRS